ncbi:hypothetical protein J4426_00940 [Candidatus Woesearchaeota archaeon]|nr:hypothetical protein [Candidatus Woesearchaeota archaeon]
MTKYIIVCGGTATGTGKTIFTASLGYIFSTFNLITTIIKFDGLLNLSFASLATGDSKDEIIWEGEEIFINFEGKKVDSDMGVYERFLDQDIPSINSIINGECYYELFKKQLNGQLKKGEILTINTHLIPIYLEKIKNASEGKDICIIEVGGTLGDAESLYFLKALSILQCKNPDEFLVVHYAYLPLKSNHDIVYKEEPFLLKIIKQSYERALNSSLKPSILAVRSDKPLTENQKNRITRDIFIDKKNIINLPSVEDIYSLPLEILKFNQEYIFLKYFKFDQKRTAGSLETYANLKTEGYKNVLVIGETESSGLYISLKESIKHALKHLKKEAKIMWLRGSEINSNLNIESFDYVIVTEGNEGIKNKIGLLKKINAPILCIGTINNLIPDRKNVYRIKEHIENKSRPMKPTILEFFQLK